MLCTVFLARGVKHLCVVICPEGVEMLLFEENVFEAPIHSTKHFHLICTAQISVKVLRK